MARPVKSARKLNVEYNRLEDEGKKALQDAAEGREGFELIF